MFHGTGVTTPTFDYPIDITELKDRMPIPAFLQSVHSHGRFSLRSLPSEDILMEIPCTHAWVALSIDRLI